MKKKSKGMYISILPLDCIFTISTFLKTYSDFLGLVLCFKGFFEYLKTFKPTDTSIEFPLYQISNFKPKDHNYSYVQNLRIIEMFSSSKMDLGQLLSHFSKLHVLTVANTDLLPKSETSLINLGSCGNLQRLSLTIPFSIESGKKFRCLDTSTFPNLENLSIIGVYKASGGYSFSTEELKVLRVENRNHLYFYFKGDLLKNLKMLRLEYIRLCRNPIQDEKRFSLKRLSDSIESLILKNSKVAGYPISPKLFPNLRNLFLEDYSRRCTTKPFVKEIKLKSLVILGQEYPMGGIEEISDSLKVKVYHLKSIDDIISRARFNNIHDLDISINILTSTVQKIDFSMLKNLKSLRIKCSKDCRLFIKRIKIEGNQKLRKLEFVQCNYIDIIFLKDLPKLDEIRILHGSEIRFTIENVDSIRKLYLKGMTSIPKGINFSQIEELILHDWETYELNSLDISVFKKLRCLKINTKDFPFEIFDKFKDLKTLQYLFIMFISYSWFLVPNEKKDLKFSGLNVNIEGEIVEHGFWKKRHVHGKKRKKKFYFSSRSELQEIILSNVDKSKEKRREFQQTFPI